MKCFPLHIDARPGSSRQTCRCTGTSLNSSDVLGGEPNWSMLIIETLAVLQKPGFLSGDEAFQVMHHMSHITCCCVQTSCMPGGTCGAHSAEVRQDLPFLSHPAGVPCLCHCLLVVCIHPPLHTSGRGAAARRVLTGTLRTHVLRSSWWEPLIRSACCRPRL